MKRYFQYRLLHFKAAAQVESAGEESSLMLFPCGEESVDSVLRLSLLMEICYLA